MSQAEHTTESNTTTHNVSGDVVAAIKEKRSALERLSESEYSIAEHAEAILNLANIDD